MDWLPKDSNPSLKILIEAFKSRSITRPQLHLCTRSPSGFLTIKPHFEHVCDVPLGFTNITFLPASSALYKVTLTNLPLPKQHH